MHLAIRNNLKTYRSGSFRHSSSFANTAGLGAAAAAAAAAAAGGGCLFWTKTASAQGESKLRILFIRHGESENNVLCNISDDEYWKHRKPDPKLSAKGEKQVQAAANALAKNPPVVSPLDKIYVSPMTRALSTAKPIAESLRMSPTVWTDMYEVGGCFGGEKGSFYGVGGLSRNEMQRLYPGYILPPEEITQHGWYPKKLRMETGSHAVLRAAAISTRLRDMAMRLEDDDSKTIALVAHHDTIDLILRDLMGLKIPVEVAPPGKVFKHYNAAFTCLDLINYKDDASLPTPCLLFQNRADHMPSKLVEWSKLGVV